MSREIGYYKLLDLYKCKIHFFLYVLGNLQNVNFVDVCTVSGYQENIICFLVY